MSDLAVGRINVVAKEALLTSVLVDDESTQANRNTCLEAILEGVSAVVDNAYLRIQGADTKGEKRMLSMAFLAGNRDRPGSDQVFVQAFYTTLKELEDRGTGLMTSMPNNQKCVYLPCGFGTLDKSDPQRIPNLVTVGNGLVNYGDFADNPSKIDELDFFMVFELGGDQKDGAAAKPGIVCAEGTGDKNHAGG